jgi:hypothetical protein
VPRKSKISLSKTWPFLKGFLFGRQNNVRDNISEVQQTRPSKLVALNPQKQKELDALCQQLFKKKDLIASGKLQLIGLEKIKTHIGARWDKLSAKVYETTEEVITRYIGKGDVFIRYKGDSYVIIFAHASRQEAKVKAGLIIEEIKRRLFALEGNDLKEIEIRGVVGEIKAGPFNDKGFPDVLDTAFAEDKTDIVFVDSSHTSREWQGTESKKKDAPKRAAAVDLNKEMEETVAEAYFVYSYVPLWDVQRGALTTYLCAPQLGATDEKGFDAYQDFYKKKSTIDRVQMDLRTLDVVIGELISMEKDNRKLFVICPVHHETLSHLENFQMYKELCQQIPAEQRKFLIFMIIDMPDGLTIKEPYRFVAPLKNFCAQVFAKNPLGINVNFKLLKESGVDGVGVWASHKSHSEEQTLELLNAFCAGAKTSKINKTFVLDISSLSLTTSAVCAGFDYLGGTGIHEDVDKPDNVYRYRHEDLISGLIQK